MPLLVLFAAFLVLSAPPVHVVGQQKDFLSIDCGLDANNSGYTDKDTRILYVSDGSYTDAGENHRVAPELESSFGAVDRTLRSFPSGQRNCYALPTVAGTRYLVRATFAYGNYDGNNSSALEFDLHLGSNYWDTAKPPSAGTIAYEAIFVAWAEWAPWCLVNTGHGTPFVSVLELRPLGAALYPLVTPGLVISTSARTNMGGAISTVRYPDDPYDRLWFPMDTTSPRWANLSTTRPIQPDSSYAVPSRILQTAVAASGNDTALTVITGQYQTKYSFMIFQHFADFQDTQLRQFDILINEKDGSGPKLKSYSPPYLASQTLYTESYKATDGRYNITLVCTNASVLLPPMINALEIYVRVPYENPTTLPQDFDAIMAIKTEYGVKKNWMGDPCFPIQYAWDGVKCSNASGNTSRITSLDLSNSSLHGTISKNFTLLTALQDLDLSYNNLSGSIPDSLPNLPSLRVLNVSGNQLSDESLCQNYTGSLIFRHDSNKSTCNKNINASRKSTVILVASVVVAVLVISAILLAYFIWRAKRKATGVHTVFVDSHTRNVQVETGPRSRTNQGDHLQDNDNRRFTYKDMEKFTDNFKQSIGQGGFGVVYFGNLEDGTEVAVKMRSESSSHGLDEFLAEVQSLTKVHHRNIVSLVGYCWEKDHLALVYEYMSQGNLYDHLRGKIAAAEALNWGTRVRIVLEAAQGLDYLHKGCSPPIIHRDVKSSNILLGQNLQAKIADLGLSKTYISDGHTHISTTAAGTAGYMDPEYYFTGRLTESSDVYSFGVVLLEAATGEPPLVPGQGHIVQRVKQRVSATGDIGSVADPRLGAAYDVNSMWKVVDTAMACTAEVGAGRPTMGEVVAQLKDSLALEYARDNDDDRSVPASIAASDSAALMMSGFGPSAR